MGQRIAARLVAAVLLASAGGVASAHQQSTPKDLSGIRIPFVSHGEMSILIHYHDEIVALADRVRQPPNEFATLLRYTGIQYADCLWGLMPGSIADEESPFNECSHAFLAGSKALLLKMRSMPEVAEKAEVLVSRIDAEVVATGAAFIGCAFSSEEFNTASLVRPRWSAAAGHAPTLMSLVEAFMGPVLLAFLGSRIGKHYGSSSRAIA